MPLFTLWFNALSCACACSTPAIASACAFACWRSCTSSWRCSCSVFNSAKNCSACTRSPGATAMRSTSDCSALVMLTARTGAMLPLTTTLSLTPSAVAMV
ncbi:hypothetical protein JKI95_10675 [Corynebacterium aquatimens]|nr:hypothetical protein JKI95_10675 [Corynebacterium aquatimens]